MLRRFSRVQKKIESSPFGMMRTQLVEGRIECEPDMRERTKLSSPSPGALTRTRPLPQAGELKNQSRRAPTSPVHGRSRVAKGDRMRGKPPRQPFTRPREARAEFSRKQRSKKSALPATLLRGRKTDALAHIRLVTGGKRDTEHHQHDNPFERLPETADCPPQMFGPSDAFKQQLLSRHAS